MSLEDRLYPFLAAYNALPPWAQFAAGIAYRILPRNWRWGARYAEFTELAKAGEDWSPTEIEEYQLKQLRFVLHHAANFCPYYKRLFMKTGFRPEHLRTVED